MNLKNKRVLITAGPTWVPIDSVRVISNIATGQSGILLAQKLAGLGAKVTLLLGPVGACRLNRKIRVITYQFFDELKGRLSKEIRSKKYDIVVHSAAVSDYQPVRAYRGKISSGLKLLRINLRPTVKLINLIKKADRSLFLVGFKFEPRAGEKNILPAARRLLALAGLDLVVANTARQEQYQAYILNRERAYGPYRSKPAMVNRLAGLMGG